MSKLRKWAGSLWLQAASVASIGAAFLVFGPAVPGPWADAATATAAPPARTDPSQAAALADGVVTREEYDASVERTLDCLRSAGGEVVGLRYEDFRDAPEWNFVVRYDQTLPNGKESPYDQCWSEFSRDIQAKWVSQDRPSAAKAASNVQAALACAGEEGLGVASFDGLVKLASVRGSADPAAVTRCLTIAQKGYDPLEHPPIAIP